MWTYTHTHIDVCVYICICTYCKGKWQFLPCELSMGLHISGTFSNLNTLESHFFHLDVAFLLLFPFLPLS